MKKQMWSIAQAQLRALQAAGCSGPACAAEPLIHGIAALASTDA